MASIGWWRQAACGEEVEHLSDRDALGFERGALLPLVKPEATDGEGAGEKAASLDGHRLRAGEAAVDDDLAAGREAAEDVATGLAADCVEGVANISAACRPLDLSTKPSPEATTTAVGLSSLSCSACSLRRTMLTVRIPRLSAS